VTSGEHDLRRVPDPNASAQQADDELRAAAGRLRAIVETAVDAIITIDADGCIETVNPATERLFGYRADEMIGHNVSMLMPEPYRSEHDAYLHRYARTAEARIIGVGREVRGRRRDGTEFPLDLAVSETLLPGRRFYTGIVRDVSERKRAEEALQRSEARLAGIIASAMDAIITVDEGQRIVVFNEAAEAIFRCRASAAIGEPLARFIPEQHRSAHAEHIQAFARTGVTNRSMWRPGVLLALRADGEEFPIEAAISQVESEGQRLFTVILRDITARTREEEELLKAKDLAESANRAKDQFLAVISHELRTPLNAIIGYTDLLNAGVAGAVAERQSEFLARIAASSRHLLELIEQVLTFTRHQALPTVPRPSLVQLAHLLAETAALMEPAALEKGIDFRVDVTRAAVAAEVDSAMLRQIVLNLLSNAVKFTPYGEVSFTASAMDNRLHIVVRDTGIGIRPENLERGFDPFYQEDSTLTRHAGGTGLGLSVVRRLVTVALGGEITVSSRPGEGSTFAACVPVQMNVVIDASYRERDL
jgi:PAS domain S-box-containing protein